MDIVWQSGIQAPEAIQGRENEWEGPEGGVARAYAKNSTEVMWPQLSVANGRAEAVGRFFLILGLCTSFVVKV